MLARGLLLVAGLLALAGIGRVAARRAAIIATSLDGGELQASLPASPADGAGPPPEPLQAAAAPAPPPSGASPPAHANKGPATPDDPVYLNYAGVEELRRLPGIGVKRAEGIVALRARLGRFQRVEELMRVKGVGRATVRKLRPLVRLDLQPPDAGSR